MQPGWPVLGWPVGARLQHMLDGDVHAHRWALQVPAVPAGLHHQHHQWHGRHRLHQMPQGDVLQRQRQPVQEVRGPTTHTLVASGAGPLPACGGSCASLVEPCSHSAMAAHRHCTTARFPWSLQDLALSPMHPSLGHVSRMCALFHKTLPGCALCCCCSCPAGYETGLDAPGATTCTPCRKGFFNAVPNTPFCTPCAPGTIADATGVRQLAAQPWRACAVGHLLPGAEGHLAASTRLLWIAPPPGAPLCRPT